MRTRCDDCGKVVYLSRKAARRASRQWPAQRLSPYRCGPWWHLGKLPQGAVEGTIAREDVFTLPRTTDEVAARRRGRPA